MSPAGVVAVELLPHGAGLGLPERATAGSAGYDLKAAIGENETVDLAPCARCLVPTGLKLALPPGVEGQVRPRSGLAQRHGVTVLNAPGTIDSDYRGEVKVLLVNLGDETFRLHRGLRVAQLIFTPYMVVKLELSYHQLSTTQRGESGFGSTGA